MTFTFEDLKSVWNDLFKDHPWPANQTRLVSIKILEDKLSHRNDAHKYTHGIPTATNSNQKCQHGADKKLCAVCFFERTQTPDVRGDE